MSGYEDIVELGFEGVDKLTHRYHDKVYSHLPAFKKKQANQQRQQERQQERQQHKQPPSAIEQRRDRQDSAVEGERGLSQTNRDMSSYGPSYNGRQDYRDDRDVRGSDQNQLPASSPVGYAYDERYQDPRAYDDQYRYGYAQQPRQNRPDMSRQRSNSWSPRDREQEDRRGRDRDQESRHRNRRERSSSGPKLTEPDCAKRLAATAVGALIGGFAANRFTKGQKYDTAATFSGAVLGGIASREIADRVGHRKDEKRGEREEEKAWEQKWEKDEKGRGERNRIEYDRDDYRDDYRDDRDRRRIRD